MPTLALRRCTTALLAASATWLAGCDQLGIESATAVAAKREAEGKAVGAGCRHAGRSIEACYETNKRADKAAVFAGWRDMEDYMRDNKIAAVPPPPPPTDATVAAGEAHDDKQEGAADKPAAKPAKAKKGS
jgi:hypothetical protein